MESPQKAIKKNQNQDDTSDWKRRYKNLRKQAKMIKQRKDAEIRRNRKEKTTQEKITIQLEDINQKGLAKEGGLNRYRLRVKQYRKTGHSKTMKVNSINN